MDSLGDNLNYSAVIDMWMESDEFGRIPLAQAASTFVIAAHPIELPVCDVRVFVTVDGRPFVRTVRLVNGMSKDNREAMILSHDLVAPF